MASAKSGVHVVQLKPISISKNLIDGCKFIRWDDDMTVGVPCILKVDKKGFFLHWIDQNGDLDFLDIATIRDTRTGKYAKTPKNEKLKESVTMGPPDQSLEDKTLTICYGTDFVNVQFLNFSTNSKDIAQEWTVEILNIAYNLLSINASVYTFLEKAHTKLCLMIDREKKLPVKNIIRMFASQKDERKRIEKALEACGLCSSKNESIPLEKFDMTTFFNFYKHLIGRTEVMAIFERICGDGNPIIDDENPPQQLQKLMTVDQFVQFLNKEQRDPRLNEILYPYANRTRGLDLIEQYEPDKFLAKKGYLTFDGFLLYLMSDDNAVIPTEKFDLNSDMDQPLSHYFINSSHNTYLTGHQLTGRSSVEIYRQCLLGGCRCIELDCWNGRSDDEPIITHGFTVVTEIPFKDVLEAIAESAFKTSDYPVILSFENHCTNKQQLAKMAKYCRQIFGDMLLTEPLPSHPLKPGVPLPSPKQLSRKIIIKDKKEHKHQRKNKNNSNSNNTSNNNHVSPSQNYNNNNNNDDSTQSNSNSNNNITTISMTALLNDELFRPENSNNNTSTVQQQTLMTNNNSSNNTNVDNTNTNTNNNKKLKDQSQGSSSDVELKENHQHHHHHHHHSHSHHLGNNINTNTNSNNNNNSETTTTTTTTITKNFSCDITDGPDTDSNSSDDEDGGDVTEEPSSSAEVSIKESTPKSEMSELVIYVQPIQFRAFEIAEKRNRSFEVSSFDETQSTSLLKEQPVDFVNYNKRQLSRIYPKGTRVNSSNFLPQVFWNSGCQMVALNFQTLDLGMQLNLGIFEYNGRNGYLLKPDFMRRQDRRFDPFTESTVDGIIAGTVSIKIISGQFLSDKRVGTYVEVDMYGLPADTVRRKKTKTVPNNGLNPIYDEEPFVFKKVVLPDLACLRVAAFEENGKFIGTRILPFVGLRPGYRHISLRSESLMPLTLPTLFVHIQVKDYIPDGLSELADALANPIAYQSMVEKHAKQLLALIDEGDDAMALSSDVENYDGVGGGGSGGTGGNNCDGGATGSGVGGGTNEDSIQNRHAMINRQFSQAEISLMKREPLNKMELNGGGGSTQTASATASVTNQLKNSQKITGSPTHKMSLMRQDTLNRKISGLRIHGGDENSLEQRSSTLESEIANLDAEPVEKLKQAKNVQKIFTKIDRDLINLNKKYDKLREKLKENYLQDEERSMQMLEKTNNSNSCGGSSSSNSTKVKPLNSLSKSVKKIGSKKQYNFDIKLTEEELKNKIRELQKTFSQQILDLYLEQYKEEFKIFENRYEQLCQALDKAMEDSQNSQKQYLTNLHDKEVQALMKRLETQTKEELTILGKSHKDKNELARIKRELQQKLIDQAVYERQILQNLLEKRKLELTEKHQKEEKKLQDEKKKMFELKEQDFKRKCEKLKLQYENDNNLFLKMFGLDIR